MNCDICGDSGVVVLPVLYRPILPEDGYVTMEIPETTRIFQCPQCKMVPKDRIATLGASRQINWFDVYEDHLQEYIRYTISDMAHATIKNALGSGLISIDVDVMKHMADIDISIGILKPEGFVDKPKFDFEAEAKKILEKMNAQTNP